MIDIIDWSDSDPNFNPRLRMGGDNPPYKTHPPLKGISIHASVWEATCQAILPNVKADYISIHASVWEATKAWSKLGFIN